MTSIQTYLSPLISEFRALSAKDSVTPEKVGYLLQKIVDNVPDADELINQASDASFYALQAKNAAESAAASSASANETAAAAKTAIDSLIDSKGKAKGLAPLGNDGKVSERFLPDIHCVCRFDLFINDSTDSINISDEPIGDVISGQTIRTAWIRKSDGTGCFASTITSGRNVMTAQSEQQDSSSQVGDIAVGVVWHKKVSTVLADSNGKPWPDKIYICTSPLSLYAAGEDGMLTKITL